jgi:protein SCO1/2
MKYLRFSTRVFSRGMLAVLMLSAIGWVGQGEAFGQTTAPNYGRNSISSVKPQAPGPQEQALAAVRWEQNLNHTLPADAVFRDDSGKQVKIGEYFSGKRPVVLAMIFYNCTMLCSEVLNGMMRSLKDVNYKPGKEYDVVVVSIDPTETPEIAAAKKKAYLEEYGFTGTEKGWHFLTGTEANIKKVTNAAGYFYTYDKTTKQYAHPGGVLMVTPQGKIARYHTGVMYEPRDLRLSLLTAGENKIGSPVDLILLRCFHYDPSSGTYSVAIMQVLRWLAAAFVVLVGGGLALWVRRDLKKEKMKNDGALIANRP